MSERSAMAQTTSVAVQAPPAGRPSTRSRLQLSRDWGRAGVLALLGFLTFIPLIMLLQLSFKSEQQMADAMWLPSLPPHVENYVRAFRLMAPSILNSMLYVVGAVGISIVCSAMCGYAMARYPFPGRDFFYMAILSLMMIPGVLTLIPRFVETVQLRLNNTFWGVWLPLAAGTQPLQVIVLRTFFASVPEELFEAARLDGATELTMLGRIAIPLAKPILTTLIVLQVNSVWSEFIWPMMVMARPARWPAALAVLNLSQKYGASDPGAQFAGYVLVGLPLLILFSLSSRAFIRGLTSGALKM